MLCPQCSAWSTVDETRKADDGYTTRRMRCCANGHRFPTYEVLQPIYRRDRRYARQVVKAAMSRAVIWKRNAAIVAALKTMSHSAAAVLFQMPKSSITTIKRIHK